MDTTGLDDRERNAAQRECGLLKELAHVNIVQYVESYQEGPSLVLIMEWCQGGDLARHIAGTRNAGGSYQDGLVARWGAQMAMALEYMHDRLVLHRDLKASNVFLTHENDVKLGDLGIAKILESTMVQAESVVGTAQYLSPELCQNKPYSFGCDMWALGCIIYELCALKRPFDASNVLRVVYCVVRDPVDLAPLADRPLEILNFIATLLTKQADHRPPAKQVAADARAFARHLGWWEPEEGTKKPIEAEDSDDYSEDEYDCDDAAVVDLSEGRPYASTEDIWAAENDADEYTTDGFESDVSDGPGIYGAAPDPTPIYHESPPLPRDVPRTVTTTATTKKTLSNSTNVPVRPPGQKDYTSARPRRDPTRRNNENAVQATTTTPRQQQQPQQQQQRGGQQQRRATIPRKETTPQQHGGVPPRGKPMKIPFSHYSARVASRQQDDDAAWYQRGRDVDRTTRSSRGSFESQSPVLKATIPRRRTYDDQPSLVRRVSSDDYAGLSLKPTLRRTVTYDWEPMDHDDLPVNPALRRSMTFPSPPPPPDVEKRQRAHALRMSLGDDAYVQVCDVLRSSYERGTDVSKQDLINIVGSQARYDLCIEVENLVFSDYAMAQEAQQRRS